MSAEQNLKIPLADGKFAYARLRGDWSQPLIIAAGEVQPGHEEYYKILSEKHIAVKLVTVPDADHGFSTDEAMEQLLAHSLQWLNNRSTP